MSPLQINQELEKKKDAISNVLRSTDIQRNPMELKQAWGKHVPAAYKKVVYEVSLFLEKANKKIVSVHAGLIMGGITYNNELLQLYQEAAQKKLELTTAWDDNFETARTAQDATYILTKVHYTRLQNGLLLFGNFKSMHDDLVAVNSKAPDTVNKPQPPPNVPSKPADTGDYWFRTAKIGDEYRGLHIARIYDMGNEYIIFSSVEDPAHLNYFYADDSLGKRLEKIAVELNELRSLLEGHPNRLKYLPAVAQVYTLAFSDNIPAANRAIAEMQKKLKPPAERPEKKPPYLLIAAIGTILGGLSIGVYLVYFRHESGPTMLLTYLGLVFLGVAIAALINAITGSSLSIKGTIKGVEYNFTGPIVAVILCVFGYFYFIREAASGKTNTTFTVRVFSNNVPISIGQVKLYITGLNLEPLPISNGQAIFSDIPGEKLQQKITIYATAPGFQSRSIIDTVIGERQDIWLNMQPIVVVPDSSTIKKPVRKKTDSSIVKPAPQKHKLGDKYQAGIIFDLDPDGEHGLIAAGQDQADDVAWWIRKTDITSNSYSLKDGYANTENIVADQGNNGAYAASMCKNYRGGGFTDWFLPAIDQLKTLYHRRHLLKNLQPGRYWSSTANGNNACFLDFSLAVLPKDNSVDFPLTRYRVRAIRRF